MGRHKSNDICLVDSTHTISRFHLIIIYSADRKIYIQDAGSRNRFFVNNNLTSFSEVFIGDQITIGNYSLYIKEFENNINPEKREKIKVTDNSSTVTEYNLEQLPNNDLLKFEKMNNLIYSTK